MRDLWSKLVFTGLLTFGIGVWIGTVAPMNSKKKSSVHDDKCMSEISDIVNVHSSMDDKIRNMEISDSNKDELWEENRKMRIYHCKRAYLNHDRKLPYKVD